jgi:hypothetical protein
MVLFQRSLPVSAPNAHAVSRAVAKPMAGSLGLQKATKDVSILDPITELASGLPV